MESPALPDTGVSTNPSSWELTTEQTYKLIQWFTRLNKTFIVLQKAKLVLFRRHTPMTIQLVAMYDGNELVLGEE